VSAENGPRTLMRPVALIERLEHQEDVFCGRFVAGGG
jgi:hypothetical protein